MREKEIVIEVRNLETDTCASIMLHDFKEQFSNYDGVAFWRKKNCSERARSVILRAWSILLYR